MFPSFNLFGKTITTYFLLSLIGALLAGWLICRLAQKRGENDNDAIVVLLFSAIGLFIGGHLLYGITNIKLFPALFNASGFSQFVEFVYSIFGGMVFYGGLIGGIIAAYITIKVKRLNLPVYADMIIVAVPFFHCFARIGCFLGGCCYGIESKIGFIAHGNQLVPAVNDVSRFPVQLLEAALNLVLFFVLYLLYKKSLNNKKLQGKLLFIYLLCYSVIRFFDEFLRGDEIRGFVLGLSTSQFISIILFVFATVGIIIVLMEEKSIKEEKEIDFLVDKNP